MTWTSDRAIQVGKALSLLDNLKKQRPTIAYKPHDRGQLQFHQSQHIVRGLFPGNGFGKTRAMASEAAWWVDHSHPYQPIPQWPITVLWFSPEFRQWELIQQDIEADCFPAGFSYNDQKHVYKWPNRSRIFILSYDRSWDHVQGINPDLVCFDEIPPPKLWAEMTMRRRGKKKTRFAIAATATTENAAYLERELYTPWQEFHKGIGIGVDQAKIEQKHPQYWIWAHGGIDDNPGADKGDREWYHSRTFGSTAEKQVRLFGGFARFNANPVFDREALMKMMLRAQELETSKGKGRLGSLVTA